jgi:hypothetical protein
MAGGLAAPPHAGDVRRAARGDEFRVLPRGRPAAAVDRGHDRVPRYRDPGRRGGADSTQRRGARAHHGRRRRRRLYPPYRAAARVRLRVRELRAVHAVRRPRPPDRERGRRPRPAGRGHDDRGGGGGTVGARRRAAGLRAPGPAAGRGGNRRMLLGDPLRDRSAGHGAAAAGHVLAHAGAAAGVRHHHRRDRAAPDPWRPGYRRHHPGGTRRRDSPGRQREDTTWTTRSWARPG